MDSNLSQQFYAGEGEVSFRAFCRCFVIAFDPKTGEHTEIEEPMHWTTCPFNLAARAAV